MSSGRNFSLQVERDCTNPADQSYLILFIWIDASPPGGSISFAPNRLPYGFLCRRQDISPITFSRGSCDPLGRNFGKNQPRRACTSSFGWDEDDGYPPAVSTGAIHFALWAQLTIEWFGSNSPQESSPLPHLMEILLMERVAEVVSDLRILPQFL